MASLARVTFTGALRAPEAISCVYITNRSKSTQVTSYNYKRGSGGRSSFSGTVATVFGAKSTLGHILVNRLGKVGSQIIIPYRGDPYKVRDLKVMGDLGQILFNEFELRDEDSIRRSVQYSNVVINLIGQDFETKNYSYRDVHVDGARRIARMAKEMGVETFVHVSAMCAGVQSNNILKGGSRFLQSKREGELAVLEEFPEAIIMRPSTFVDLNDRFLNYYTDRPRAQLKLHASRHVMMTKVQLWHGGEETIKTPVLPSDVATGIINSLKDPDAPGRIYQCVGPESYKLYDLVSFMYRLRLQRVQIQDAYLLTLMRAKFREKVYKTIGFPLPYITPDILEKETVSEIVDPLLPTLVDLGVTPKNVEEKIRFLYRPFLDSGVFKERIGTLVQPKSPPTVQMGN